MIVTAPLQSRLSSKASEVVTIIDVGNVIREQFLLKLPFC